MGSNIPNDISLVKQRRISIKIILCLIFLIYILHPPPAVSHQNSSWVQMKPKEKPLMTPGNPFRVQSIWTNRSCPPLSFHNNANRAELQQFDYMKWKTLFLTGVWTWQQLPFPYSRCIWKCWHSNTSVPPQLQIAFKSRPPVQFSAVLNKASSVYYADVFSTNVKLFAAQSARGGGTVLAKEPALHLRAWNIKKGRAELWKNINSLIKSPLFFDEL